MKIALRILIPVMVIAVAWQVAKSMIASEPSLKSKQPPAIIPTVTVIERSPKNHSPLIFTFGTVQSYFETTLTPQVSGNITYVSEHFRVGREVAKGEVLAKIDTTDYTAVLARETATLTSNQRTLEEEIIRSKQAKDDWIASGRKLSSASPFVLRKPQLAAATASITASKAAIQKAQADIDRCTITASFDAIISQRQASVGNFASAQTPLGTLIATQKAEIRLPLTPVQATRIQLPNKSTSGQKITLTSPTKAETQWNATLVRTEPVINPTNQVIFIIAEIDQPYTGVNSLPIGTFVNASIPAQQVANAIEVPEVALVNDSYVWAVDAQKKLVKVASKRIYSHLGNAYIKIDEKGLKPPYSIVSRPLTNFRTGMQVKLLAPQN